MVKRLTVSLIIPMFNEATFLPQLFASIRASSMAPDEIIFCDNGSTDDSIAIVKKLGKGLPYRIVHEKQKGILYAVETAWRAATQDIILKADVDSTLYPYWIEHAVHHFTNDPTLAACTGPLIGADGTRLQRMMTTIASTYVAMGLTLAQGYPLLLGANSSYRKSALEKVNGYKNHNGGLDDHVISKKFAAAGFKTRWFWDMALYHSTRRFHGRPLEYVAAPLSFIHPSFYHEKTS